MKEQDAVAIYDTSGGKMQQKLQDLRGTVNPKHLEKVYAPDGGMMGKINEAVRCIWRCGSMRSAPSWTAGTSSRTA